MKYWSVAFHVDATGFVYVEAETEEEARRVADNEFLPTVENTELGDPVEIVECVELTKKELDHHLRFSWNAEVIKNET